MWLHLAAACTGISNIYWKVFLKIPAKIPAASTKIIVGNPNGAKKFPKSHCADWSDVISFIPMDDPITNPVIQSMNMRILRDPYQSGMYPGSQKSINTTPNGLSDSIVLSNCCDSREHEFTNRQYAQALIKCYTSLLTIIHQNRASIMNKVLCSWLCTANGDT